MLNEKRELWVVERLIGDTWIADSQAWLTKPSAEYEAKLGFVDEELRELTKELHQFDDEPH